MNNIFIIIIIGLIIIYCTNKIFDKNVLPVPISKIEGMDINDSIDLKIARSLSYFLT